MAALGRNLLATRQGWWTYCHGAQDLQSRERQVQSRRLPKQSPAPGQSPPSSGWRVATSGSQRRPTNGMQTRGCSIPQAASSICGPAIYGPPGAKTTAPRSPQSPQVASARCGSSSSNRIFAGDADLIAYMQRMCGYALTGDVSEHALFFGHGSGANGKGRFVAAISGIMGSYATTAPMEVFTDSKTDRHPTELAGLMGARLVTAQETEKGRRWAETRIKTMTGGDKISARFMRQDFFEFTPQFKLLIMGNHRPGLRGVDELIRRRMNSHSLHRYDSRGRARPRSGQKAARGVAGHSGMDDHGLPEVAGGWATHARGGDQGNRCISQQRRCDRHMDGGVLHHRPERILRQHRLVQELERWAERAGEFVGSQKSLSQTLNDRGFVKARSGSGPGMFPRYRHSVQRLSPTRPDATASEPELTPP